MAVAHTHEETGAQFHDHKERSCANTWNEQDSPGAPRKECSRPTPGFRPPGAQNTDPASAVALLTYRTVRVNLGCLSCYVQENMS